MWVATRLADRTTPAWRRQERRGHRHTHREREREREKEREEREERRRNIHTNHEGDDTHDSHNGK